MSGECDICGEQTLECNCKRTQLIEDLVNTFQDREAVHKAYKSKMKEIISYTLMVFFEFMHNNPKSEPGDVLEWVNNFVEKTFKVE